MFGKERRWRSTKKTRKVDPAAALQIRLWLLRLLIIAIFGVLGAQLWKLQIVEGQYYREKAEYNRLRLFSTSPTRGVIYDRRGTLLVRNVPSFTVAVIPAALPKPPDVVYERLSSLLSMPASAIQAAVDERRGKQDPFMPVPIKTNVDQNTAFVVEEQRLDLPGAVVETESIRQYTAGPSMSHILGYVYRISPEEYESLKGSGYGMNDKLGKTGVELIYEQQLRGKLGWELIEVDASERKVGVLNEQKPEPGYNLVLSIDLDLERKLAEYLESAMGESKYAAAVAMDPNTGEVLAMVSLPSYDNNLFADTISNDSFAALLNDPRRPLLNYAIGARHPPGSIFKVITGAGALQEGVATRDTHIFGGGGLRVASDFNPAVSYYFKDWAWLGDMDFIRGLAMSSDVYFYTLAGGHGDVKGLGIDRLVRYAREFGLGAPTGVDLPGEVGGLVPDPKWKEETWKQPWYLGDTYFMGIGQGYLLVTPLQMANVVSAVANGGFLYRPQVVREVVDSNGKVVRPFRPQPLHPDRPRVPVAEEHLATIREGMLHVLDDDGTAPGARVPGVLVAGKTGSAEYGEKDPKTGEYPTHAWFMAFAPYEKPEIAVVVFVERGKGGAATAAPVVQKFLTYYFERKNRASP